MYGSYIYILHVPYLLKFRDTQKPDQGSRHNPHTLAGSPAAPGRDEVEKWKNCKCWMILSQGCMKVWKSRRWQRPIQPWGVLVSANKFANRAVWWHLKPKKWSLALRWTCWAVKKSTWCTRLCFQRLLVGGGGWGLKTFWTKAQSFSLFPLVPLVFFFNKLIGSF